MVPVVQSAEGSDVPGALQIGQLIAHLLQPAQSLVTTRQANEITDHLSDPQTHRPDVTQLLGVECGDPGAATLPLFHQSLELETVEDLADRGPAYPESLCQLLLSEPGPGGQVEQNDLFPQRGMDVVPAGLEAQRGNTF